MSFRLTYATMFDPPAELHTRFEAALAEVEAGLGAEHRLFIAGRDVDGSRVVEQRSPIDRNLVLGRFHHAGPAEVARAMAAATAAFPAWRATPPERRVELLRKAASILEARVFHLAAALVLEVGKNRMEALGEAQEAADFFTAYCDAYEAMACGDRPLPDDPLPGWTSTNRSVARPYGVWAVIAPFNFPLALAAGPAAAALVAGNTVVAKGASDTPWAVRLLAEALRDAGIPEGVFNHLCGGGAAAGEALVRHPAVAGLTFTGSHAVGMGILRHFAQGDIPRPCILEMGGKNPVIVTRHADLDRAALGITRSAFGMGGQKCSALSRIYVEAAVADNLIARLRERIGALALGDPRRRETYLGPVIHAKAQADHARYCEELRAGGAKVHAGGEAIDDASLAKGFYVAPTLAEAPLGHRLWGHEMFLPLATLARVKDREEAMTLANATPLGLTAGVYGSEDDVAWFHEHIEAGVTYANRPQGATTGAWPGYQPFGGWKGSGSTGKGIASFYYLPLYLREQSRTVVR